MEDLRPGFVWISGHRLKIPIGIYISKRAFWKPYQAHEAVAGFDEFVRRQNYQRAIALGERLLRQDPVNFGVLLKLMKCYFETNQTKLAELARAKAQVLHNAILHSGNGHHESSPIQVIDISDEYAIMGLMVAEPVSRKAQMKSSSILDHWKVRTSTSGKKTDLFFELLLNRDVLRKMNEGN